MQTKFQPLIFQMNHVLEVVQIMNKASQVFKIPLIVSEHNPKTFGNTIESIKIPENAFKYEKVTFSMLNEQLQQHLATQNRT